MSHFSVGIVKLIDETRSEDPDVTVDFQEQIGWRGKLSEIMKIKRGSNSPKRARKSGAVNSKLLPITNPQKIIDESSSSSNPDLLDCLFDGDRDTFWKSSLVDQSENQIWIKFKIREGLRIDQLRMRAAVIGHVFLKFLASFFRIILHFDFNF